MREKINCGYSNSRLFFCPLFCSLATQACVHILPEHCLVHLFIFPFALSLPPLSPCLPLWKIGNCRPQNTVYSHKLEKNCRKTEQTNKKRIIQKKWCAKFLSFSRKERSVKVKWLLFFSLLTENNWNNRILKLFFYLNFYNNVNTTFVWCLFFDRNTILLREWHLFFFQLLMSPGNVGTCGEGERRRKRNTWHANDSCFDVKCYVCCVIIHFHAVIPMCGLWIWTLREGERKWIWGKEKVPCQPSCPLSSFFPPSFSLVSHYTE